MEKEKQKPDSAPKERVIDEQKEAVKWSTRYKVAFDYQLPMFEKWSKWYDDMYAHVHNQRMALWRSRVYMPIIASKVWDLISRFIQYRPGWDVSIRTLPVDSLSREKYDKYMQEMNEKVEKVRFKLEYDYDNPAMEESIQDELLGVMMDAAVTGQGVGRVAYCEKDIEHTEWDAENGQQRMSKANTKTGKEGYNSFKAVNIFKWFIRPGAEGLQKSPWIIIHDFVPRYEIEKNKKYKNTQNVNFGAMVNTVSQYEASRNRLVNAQDTVSLDNTIDMAEIFECWDKENNECIIYAIGQDKQNWVEIYRGFNVYWHKKYPFVPFYIRRKPYQFWGESLFENSESLQAAINDIFNHHMDQLNMSDGMLAIEEGSVLEPYVVEPGGEFRYRGEIPKQLKFPSPEPAQLQTVLNVINGVIENATISQYASGVPNSQTDNTSGTATGVTRMMEAAAEKVGFMRSNFRRSWREVGTLWTSNSQQYMNHDVLYERTVRGEKKYEVIRPGDLPGMYSIKVDDGSFEPISKDEKRKNFLEFIANTKTWQDASVAQAERTQSPDDAVDIDWNEVFIRGADIYGENPSHFIKNKTTAPTPEAAPALQPDPAMTEMLAGAAPMSPEEAFGEGGIM